MYDNFLVQGTVQWWDYDGTKEESSKRKNLHVAHLSRSLYHHANLLQPEHSPSFKLSSMLIELVIQCSVDMIIGIFKSRTMCFDIIVKGEISDLLKKFGAC